MGAYKQITENAGDTKRSWLARCWLAVGLAVSALLFVRAMPHSPLRASRPPTKSATVATSTFAEKKATPDVNPATHRTETVYVRKLITQPIETIRVGQRVLGTNPNREEVEAFEEPDPTTWRTIEVEQIKPSGKRLYATLLRPREWIEEELDPETNTIELDLPELGVEGPATILSVGPCPPIASGPGQVVTATFRHEPDGELVTVTIGADEIGCTANHPFWSEDRQEFVEAGHLRVGEHVRTRLDEVAAVVAIKPRPPTAWVYNLEVQREHVYEVGLNGVLVHNAYVRLPAIADDLARKGFHVHVGKVELTMLPTGTGNVVFKSVFRASTANEKKAVERAIRIVEREMQDPRFQQQLYQAVERAFNFLHSNTKTLPGAEKKVIEAHRLLWDLGKKFGYLP